MESLITKERKEGSTVQYNIGEKPTVTLYTYINHHLGTPNQKETRLVIIGLSVPNLQHQYVKTRGIKYM